MQILKQYPQLERHLKFSSRPIKIALHVVKYRECDGDWDNRITTIQDVLFGYNKRQKKYIGFFRMDDSHKQIEFYPGTWTVDKVNLTSSDDDYFILEFLDDAILVAKESW